MTTSAGASPRYVWYGRVSTEDEQDPTLSFPRQLANAERQVEEAGGRIVAHYYDIESGTRTYAARGSGGLAGFDIPIPRDGGLQDLLADAARRRHPSTGSSSSRSPGYRAIHRWRSASKTSCAPSAYDCALPTNRWRSPSAPSSCAM
jgi:hypothetical protein